MECVAILDAYDIGSDHRPVLASLLTDTAIPHISSKTEQEAIEEDTDKPPQPNKTYAKSTTDEIKWEEYNTLVVDMFMANPQLITIPDDRQAIDAWSNEVTTVIQDAINTTVEWAGSTITKTTTEPILIQKRGGRRSTRWSLCSPHTLSYFKDGWYEDPIVSLYAQC
jgi:hypothetical protein